MVGGGWAADGRGRGEKRGRGKGGEREGGRETHKYFLRAVQGRVKALSMAVAGGAVHRAAQSGASPPWRRLEFVELLRCPVGRHGRQRRRPISHTCLPCWRCRHIGGQLAPLCCPLFRARRSTRGWCCDFIIARQLLILDSHRLPLAYRSHCRHLTSQQSCSSCQRNNQNTSRGSEMSWPPRYCPDSISSPSHLTKKGCPLVSQRGWGDRIHILLFAREPRETRGKKQTCIVEN